MDLERRSDQIVDKIDLRPGHVIERDRVDEHRGAGALDDHVVLAPGTLGVELVLKPRASAAGHAHAQHRTRRLLAEDFTNPERCPFGNSDVGGHDLLQPSIKSIDVRAATYQHANRFTYRLKDYVNRLSEYEGGNLQNVQVDLSQVTERVLELIVPKGSLTVMQRAVIKAANIRAQTAGSYPVRIIVKDF